MALGGFLSSLGTGLSNFAGSGLGQAAIGAGLGYGADRLTGGKGGIGALAGGLLGGANAFSGGAGLFGGGDFGQSALGQGLFGQPAQQTGILGQAYTPLAEGATRQVAPQTTGGLLGGIQNFGNQYGDTLGALGDLAQAYGTVSSGMSQRDAAQAEIDYRNRVANLQERDFNRAYENQEATNQAAIDAFNRSRLNNYYSA